MIKFKNQYAQLIQYHRMEGAAINKAKRQGLEVFYVKVFQAHTKARFKGDVVACYYSADTNITFTQVIGNVYD